MKRHERIGHIERTDSLAVAVRRVYGPGRYSLTGGGGLRIGCAVPGGACVLLLFTGRGRMSRRWAGMTVAGQVRSRAPPNGLMDRCSNA